VPIRPSESVTSPTLKLASTVEISTSRTGSSSRNSSSVSTPHTNQQVTWTSFWNDARTTSGRDCSERRRTAAGVRMSTSRKASSASASTASVPLRYTVASVPSLSSCARVM
jgi:hypothetical protein